MRKLLIVSGCSFTTDNYQSLQHPHLDTNWPKWPELLAEKLDMDLINLARSGAGNEYIFSSLFDQIVAKRKDRIGYIIAAWSQVQRRDYSETRYKHTRWTDSRVDVHGDIHYHIAKSIRYYYMFQELCEKHKLPYKQFSMIEPFRNHVKELEKSLLHKNVNMDLAVKTFKEQPAYKLIKAENFIGWPGIHQDGYNIQSLITDEKKKTELQISLSDTHPNKLGHEKYAEFIYENL